MSTKEIKKLKKRLKILKERQEVMKSSRARKSERNVIAEDHDEWARLFREQNEILDALSRLESV